MYQTIIYLMFPSSKISKISRSVQEFNDMYLNDNYEDCSGNRIAHWRKGDKFCVKANFDVEKYSRCLKEADRKSVV